MAQKNPFKSKHINFSILDTNYKNTRTKRPLSKDVVIQKSWLGQTCVFEHDGNAVKCLITHDKRGLKFSNFTPEKELMKNVNRRTGTKTETKKRSKYFNFKKKIIF